MQTGEQTFDLPNLTVKIIFVDDKEKQYTNIVKWDILNNMLLLFTEKKIIGHNTEDIETFTIKLEEKSLKN